MSEENPYLRDLFNQEAESEESIDQAALDRILEEERPQFSAGFADRVMARLEQAPIVANIDDYLPRMFRWVAVGGMAAAIALLVITWYQQDSVSLDALTGIADLGLSDSFALNSF